MSAVKVSTSAGRVARGVVAAKTFRKGETIEVAPVIVVPRSQGAALKQTKIDDYAFQWGGGSSAIALGCGSLYNHSYSPNADYEQDTKNLCMKFTALRPIRKGEQITINYNGNPDCADPLWFPVEDI
jgi:SET domain-containing protein